MEQLSCLFIDHVYHKKTQSTKFLQDLLSKTMRVDVLWLDDFSEHSFERMLEAKCDFFVCFQYDFLASFLLAHNKKVLSIPMYDGTGEMPAEHWLLQHGAMLINFSESLHKKTLFLGSNSVFQRYYPNPDLLNVVEDYNNPKVFFWERASNSGLSVLWLSKKLKELENKPTHVHLHLHADPTESESVHQLAAKSLFPYAKVTVSTWFDSREEFKKTLSQFNVYIAPRATEGIGFSFIEAMSLGMVVVGLDRPTLNEYIENGKTGYLLSSLDAVFPEFDVAKMKNIGEAARQDVSRGYGLWVQEWPKILEKICLYVKSDQALPNFSMSPSEAAELAREFFVNQQNYLRQVKKVLSSNESPTFFSSIKYKVHKALRANLVWFVRVRQIYSVFKRS